MGRTRHPPAIDIAVSCPLWNGRPNAKRALRRAIRCAAAVLPLPADEVSIALADDPTVRALNRRWRHKDMPTNVLSFPASAARAHGGTPRLLGDIVIAYETVEREAHAQRKPFAEHLMHLAVHGFLHLAGYDHEADGEAQVMEHLESAILARLGVPNPYASGQRAADT